MVVMDMIFRLIVQNICRLLCVLLLNDIGYPQSIWTRSPIDGADGEMVMTCGSVLDDDENDGHKMKTAEI